MHYCMSTCLKICHILFFIILVIHQQMCMKKFTYKLNKLYTNECFIYICMYVYRQLCKTYPCCCLCSAFKWYNFVCMFTVCKYLCTLFIFTYCFICACIEIVCVCVLVVLLFYSLYDFTDTKDTRCFIFICVVIWFDASGYAALVITKQYTTRCACR